MHLPRILSASVPLTLVLAAALAQSASADFLNWTNAGGDGRWSNPANWDLGHIPGGTDYALIDTPGSDWVVIDGPGTFQVGTLVSSHAIEIQSAALKVNDDAHLFGGVTMVAITDPPEIINNGFVEVSNFATLYGGIIAQLSSATFTFNPGCVTTVVHPVQFWRGWISSHGSLSLHAPIGLGAFTPEYTTFVVEKEGSCTFENAQTGVDFVGTAFGAEFRSYGTCVVNEGASTHPKVKFNNHGLIAVYGGTLSIGDFGSILGASDLTTGSYEIYNGARITQSHQLDQISGGVSVILSGTNAAGVSSSFDGLATTKTVDGTLYVDAGASLTLAPDFFGTVVNNGRVGVGPGSTITINGSYACSASGTHSIAIADTTPSGTGVLQTYGGINLDGTLQVDFYDDSLAGQIGARYVVANLVDPQGIAVSGQFDSNVVLPDNGHATFVEYAPNEVRLVIGSTCAADLDANGAVDAADLAILLASWGGPGYADFDKNGMTDAADLAVLLATWGTCS